MVGAGKADASLDEARRRRIAPDAEPHARFVVASQGGQAQKPDGRGLSSLKPWRNSVGQMESPGWIDDDVQLGRWAEPAPGLDNERKGMGSGVLVPRALELFGGLPV